MGVKPRGAYNKIRYLGLCKLGAQLSREALYLKSTVARPKLKRELMGGLHLLVQKYFVLIKQSVCYLAKLFLTIMNELPINIKIRLFNKVSEFFN